jgi:hypothetical protein
MCMCMREREREVKGDSPLLSVICFLASFVFRYALSERSLFVALQSRRDENYIL